MIGGATILILQVCLIGAPSKCEQLTIEISDPNYQLFENKKMCYQYGKYEAKEFNKIHRDKRVKKWQCIKKPIRTIDA